MSAYEKLTAKRRAFVREYLIDRNGSQAALRAGYTTNRANQAAHELLTNPDVQTALREMEGRIQARWELKVDELIREAARVAFSDVSKIVGENGQIKLPHELDRDTARAVASFEIDDLGRVKYRFWDKNSAQERLFKHLGLFDADNRQKADPLRELAAAITGQVVGANPDAARAGLEGAGAAAMPTDDEDEGQQ